MTAARYLSGSGLSRLVAARALPVSLEDNFEGLAKDVDRLADARIVLLGESTHGTSEFYHARAAITRRLIGQHGFRLLAIEADWPDTAELDRYIRRREPWGEQDAFVNFPRWMWRNEEFSRFLADIRHWNALRPPADQAAVYGLDIYSLDKSMAAVLNYLDRVDPPAAELARRRYACLSPFVGRPQIYGAQALNTGRTCEDEVVRQLIDLLNARVAYIQQDGDAFDDTEQNARVVCAAEQYYRAMYRGSVQSWNLRDFHMFSTLRRLLDRKGPEAKAVVWAHNSHIGDARATAMGQRGEYNIGQLCREHFGSEVAAVGFVACGGTVLAADSWDGPSSAMQIMAPLASSWEQVFIETDMPAGLLNWRHDPELADILDQTHIERAIGVIYRPETERWSHYFGANLTRQFDALVWMIQTTAVTPLAGLPPEGAPDTYPFGI